MKKKNIKKKEKEVQSSKNSKERDKHLLNSNLKEIPLTNTKEPKVQEESKVLREELEEVRKKYLYLRAEFDNYKKNKMREQFELKKYSSQSLVTSLLSVLDIFDQALGDKEQEHHDSKNFKKGIEMTALELKNILKNHGVEEVFSKEGFLFDPNFHEALSHQSSSSVSPGHIVKVYRKAYKFHDRLLRPAQVIVAKESESLSKSSPLDEKTKEDSSS